MVLRDVREVPPEQLDGQVRLWSREVREASYDMEDILDTFLVEVAAPTENKDYSLSERLQKKIADLFKKSKARHTIAGAIEVMKQRLQEADDRRKRFSVPVACPAKASTLDPRLAEMHKEAAQLIGIEKTRAELIAKLLPTPHGNVDSDISGSSNKMKIVSVVGAGGLGKTTLAMAVYEELKQQYECTAFIPIGRQPNLAQVLKDILRRLGQKEDKAILEVNNEFLLIEELRIFLQNKRYFIVIDDVWEVATWNAIKSGLVENDSGSRVITTTRKQEVANRGEVYTLCSLSNDNSEKLFKTRLFGVKGEYPANHPVGASEKILKKCGGVPLAIITMASMLVGKSREFWFDVCKSHDFYRHNKDNKQVDDTVWILSLSYYDLPSYLKTCLLYLSVYPEDYFIEKESLIWKWIAEGFVQTETGTGLYHRGEEYFNELINRNMIQAVESEIMGIVYGCRVHDMVLDLIRDMSDNENFVTISTNGDRGKLLSPRKVRRLAHQKRMMKQTQQDDHMGMAQVRSLVACRCDIESWVLHPSFKLLRVLDLEGCSIRSGWQGLKHLGNLLHLRYLGLRNTFHGPYELPEEIGKLKFLQIFDFEESDIEVLPLSVCQLTQLVCLRGHFHTSAPDGLFLTKVTSFEELHIRIDKLDEESKRQFIKDLGNLREVRVLNIISNLKGIMQTDLVQSSLGNLHKLQHLELMSYNSSNDATREWGEWDRVVLLEHLRHLNLHAILFRRVPSCISPTHLPNLYFLWLRVENMDEASLRTLGGLPELRYLRLITRNMNEEGMRATVPNITVGDAFFQNLRSCDLFGWMVQLVVNEDSTSVSFSIWNGQGAMPFVGSKTENECSRSVAPPRLMTNLQELNFPVPVRTLYKDGNGGCGNLGLQCLPTLCEVKIRVDCEGASAEDVDKAEAELRNAAQLHPDGPTIKMERRNKHSIMAQSTDQDDKEPEEQKGDLSSAGDEVAVTESRDDDPATPSC